MVPLRQKAVFIFTSSCFLHGWFQLGGNFSSMERIQYKIIVVKTLSTWTVVVKRSQQIWVFAGAPHMKSGFRQLVFGGWWLGWSRSRVSPPVQLHTLESANCKVLPPVHYLKKLYLYLYLYLCSSVWVLGCQPGLATIAELSLQMQMNLFPVHNYISLDIC